jgi:tetratricopeptide (TPR) repeat protein
LRADPNLVDARLLVAQVYLRARDGAAAQKELRRALALGADPAALRFDLVEAQLQSPEFQAVVYSLTPDSVPQDKLARALGLRGRAYIGLGKKDEANRAFAEAVELDPKNRETGAGLVQLAILEGDIDTADAASSRLLEQFPDDVDVMLLCAEVDRRAERPEAALDMFGAALDREPENLRGLLGMAALVELRPDDLGSQAMLAMLLGGEGNADEALPIYEQLYAAGQTNLLILNNLAWILHERGDARALEIAGKAYELDPNRPEVADTFGWILFNAAEAGEAQTLLDKLDGGVG